MRASFHEAVIHEDAEALFQAVHALKSSSGTQALERFIEYRPDIVLLDIMMPGMDGFTACAKLRELVGGR